jgi:hypothetical protein
MSVYPDSRLLEVKNSTQTICEPIFQEREPSLKAFRYWDLLRSWIPWVDIYMEFLNDLLEKRPFKASLLISRDDISRIVSYCDQWQVTALGAAGFFPAEL